MLFLERATRGLQPTVVEVSHSLSSRNQLLFCGLRLGSAKPITDFRQREPQEGEPATEKTEVRILYTRSAVYFGIDCFDSEPSRIIATELRRDVSQDLDDHFEIPYGQKSQTH